MFKKFPHLVFYASIIISLFSCGSGAKNNSEGGVSEQTPADSASSASVQQDTNKMGSLAQFKYDKLISNIPIPFDILRFHAEVPLKYNSNSVNSTSNLSHYMSNSSKAITLGIYGGDLAYSIIYEKSDDRDSYLNCVKKLADDLGIPLAFNQNTLAAYKKFAANKDSLEKIVFNSYSEVDKALKSNERVGLASLVVAGGWLEGLYSTLTTLGKIPKNERSQNLYKKIGEQKNYLDMIIGLLEQFKDDKAFISIIGGFKSIKAAYDGFPDNSSLSEAEIAILTHKIEGVRSNFIAH